MYSDLDTLKRKLEIDAPVMDHDTDLREAGAAVMVWIDHWTRRTWQGSVTEPRSYMLDSNDPAIRIDDARAITLVEEVDGNEATIITDDVWWTPGDYADYIFPNRGYFRLPPITYRVTAEFGRDPSDRFYPVVRSASDLAIIKLWKTPDVMFSSSGSPTLGQTFVNGVLESDTMITDILRPAKRVY